MLLVIVMFSYYNRFEFGRELCRLCIPTTCIYDSLLHIYLKMLKLYSCLCPFKEIKVFFLLHQLNIL